MRNREAIHAEIDRQIAASDATRGFAVMLIGIFDLRQIELRYGGICGEQAEVRVALLIRNALRPGDRVFQAGDEAFLVVLPGLHTVDRALLAATRVTAAFDQPHALAFDTPPWLARVSLGLALYPRDGADADSLWRNAQLAADEARRRGDKYAFHDPRTARPRIDYQELRDGIDSNRLATWFQPIWNLARHEAVGVESLARWTSPTLGRVSPDDFVTFAEQNNLIASLTRWSIHATMRHAAALRGWPGGFLVAINLSPRTLSRGGVEQQLLDALSIWGIAPDSVIAEVTETALARDMEAAVQALRGLRDRGLRVAIDDFGMGYASITYLSRFPASELKIDKSLVLRMRTDPSTAKLVDSIIKFAHNLGLQTTAEGIEDSVTQGMLTDMGCELGQGFHLGRPEPAADFIARFTAAGAPAPAAIGMQPSPAASP